MRTGDLVRAAFVAALLTGCSDPHAGTLPTTSPTVTTPSVTATTTPPASPDAEVAAAAVAYYVTLQASARTPAEGADRLARLVHPSCACMDVVALLRRLARDHQRLEMTLTTRDVRVARVTATEATAFLNVEQGAGRVVDDHGRTLRTTPPSSGRYTLTFLRVQGTWLVKQIARST